MVRVVWRSRLHGMRGPGRAPMLSPIPRLSHFPRLPARLHPSPTLLPFNPTPSSAAEQAERDDVSFEVEAAAACELTADLVVRRRQFLQATTTWAHQRGPTAAHGPQVHAEIIVGEVLLECQPPLSKRKVIRFYQKPDCAMCDAIGRIGHCRRVYPGLCGQCIRV